LSEESARPQDVGRPHRRTAPGPSPATAAVLEAYRAAMRVELGALLETLGARRVGLMPDAPPELVVPIAERVKLWDLAIKIGRELNAPGAADLDPEPEPPASTSASRRSRQAPRLSGRERRSLGG
jgi:hypothetical protein